MALFSEIPQFIHRSGYQTTVDWYYLEHTLQRWLDPKDSLCRLDIDPPFQRAHVWTEAQ